MHATIEIMRRNLYYYYLLAPSIYIFVLRAHTIRGESHNQCNATGKVATRRSEARGVPGGATAPQNFAWPPQWPSQMKMSGSAPGNTAGYLDIFDWMSFSFQPDPVYLNEIKCGHAKILMCNNGCMRKNYDISKSYY